MAYLTLGKLLDFSPSNTLEKQLGTPPAPKVSVSKPAGKTQIEVLKTEETMQPTPVQQWQSNMGGFFKKGQVTVYENGKPITSEAPILENLGHVGQNKYVAAENTIRGIGKGDQIIMRSAKEAESLLSRIGATITRNETGANAPILDLNKINSNTNGHFGEHINFEIGNQKGTITIQSK